MDDLHRRRLNEGPEPTLVIAPSAAIRREDRIVVLDHGRVVEEGTFAVLIARDGPFARLVEAGLAGEVSDGPDAADGL